MYCRDMYLVYLIKLPIVNENELLLYKILLAPVLVPTSDVYVYIKPDIEYLAVGNTK